MRKRDFGSKKNGLNEHENIDPLTLLCHTFSLGYPLLIIFNELEAEPRWDLDQYEGNTEHHQSNEQALFQFLKACHERFDLSSHELPLLMDFQGNDNLGFLKVRSHTTKMVLMIHLQPAARTYT
jgi:CDC24 Calponin